MIIKSINNTVGYKGLNDGFKVNFSEDITYIVGDNFKTKSTILGLPLWVLTGYNMYGSNQEDVRDDKRRNIKNVIAEITIIDNDGVEHTITRSKGKNNIVLLDGIRTTKEVMARFFKDIQFFLCSYNPYRFSTLDLAKQKELLLRLLPPISKEDAFKLITEEEQKIIGEPIIDNTGYSKNKRDRIKELKFEIERLEGMKDALIPTALMQEDEKKVFTKQSELETLENEYERILQENGELLNLDDIRSKIDDLTKRINHLMNVELLEAKEKKVKLEEKLLNSHICYNCKQEIKNRKMIENLERADKVQLGRLKEKMAILKASAKEYLTELNQYKVLFNELNTSENNDINKRRKDIDKKIQDIRNEKNQIEMFNSIVENRKKSIIEAKRQIETIEKSIEKLKKEIDNLKLQIQISDKMKLLIIAEQMKGTEGLLKDVSIEFSTIDLDTGEIKEDYQVKYKGREYNKLSQSEKMRADFEIANFINKKSGINTTMFIDDTERIREIKISDDIQVVVALYIKYSDLDILYDYNDVLRKKKESIEEQLIQDESFVYLKVA